MSENFFEKLKSKFPALAGKQNKKNTSLDVDDSEISSTDGTENIDLDKLDSAPTKEKNEGSDSASKIRSLVIYIVVAAGVAYYAFDEYVVKPNAIKEAQVEAEMMEKLKKKKSNKLSNIKAVAEEANKVEENKADEKNSGLTNGASEKSIEQAPGGVSEIIDKLENSEAKKIDVSDPVKNMDAPTQIAMPKTEESTPAPEEKKIVEEKTLDLESAKVQEEIAKIEKNLPKKETKKQEIKSEKSKLEEEVPPESATTIVSPSAEATVTEYVSPPDYSNLGRGLVYNCKEKYWACVGKEAFIQCKKNNLYNQQNNKTIECSSSDVFQSTADCQKMQLYKINKVTNTDFCK